MRIFLTGATGYIGAAVLDALVRGGHDVTALVRDNEQGGAHRRARRPSDRRQSRGSRVVPRGRRGAGRLHPHGVRFDVGRRSGDRACGARVDHRGGEAAAHRRASKSPGKRFIIYTSGVWVLGRRRSRPTEETPVNPVSLRGVAAGPRAARPARPAAAVCGRSSFDRASCTAAATASSATSSSRPPTAWCASSATATITGRSCTTAISRICTRGWRRDDDASGVYHANDEGDERVNDIVSAISPYLPVRPDVRHVPIEEARQQDGGVRRRACARSGGPQPARARARLDADAAFGGGQRRAAARGVARVAEPRRNAAFAAGSTTTSARAAGARFVPPTASCAVDVSTVARRRLDAGFGSGSSPATIPSTRP